MLRPRPVPQGGTIAIVSPASAVERGSFDATIERLEQEGYRVLLGEHVYDKDAFLAGKDEDRIADLNWAFFTEGIDAVLCSRGGYGCQRLIPKLDLKAMAATRRLFLGFSDITSLHLALNHAGLATAYAPMAWSLGRPRSDLVWDSFLAVLKGQPQSAAPIEGIECIRGGTASGILTGACLTLLSDSMGTPWAMRGAGRIVLLEDIGEQAYRIDGHLTQLLAAGAFDDVAGIVVGEMTNTDPNKTGPSVEKTWQEVVKERLGPLDVPMIFNYPFGHIDEELTVPLGIEARLDADARTLTFGALAVP